MNQFVVIRNSITALALLCSTGCLSTNTPKLDAEIRRSSEEAFEALAETSTDAALGHYRRAIRRAWVMNHPEEISRLSYNIAATLNAAKNYPEAQAWLLEARAAAVQADSKTDHVRTLLLNAQVARKMHNYAAAEQYLRLADGVRKCGREKPGPSRSCTLPGCLTKHCDAKAEKQLLQLNLEVQAIVERAELDIDLGQLKRAKQLLAHANSLVKDTDADRTSLHRVHARIHETEGQFGLAGRNYFEEARSLRKQQQYRAMAAALESAATSFEKAGDPVRAAELYHHAARANFGRGAVRAALCLVQAAKHNADASRCHALIQRVSLLFREIDLEVSQDAPAPAPTPNMDAAGATELQGFSTPIVEPPQLEPPETPIVLPPPPTLKSNDTELEDTELKGTESDSMESDPEPVGTEAEPTPQEPSGPDSTQPKTTEPKTTNWEPTGSMAPGRAELAPLPAESVPN